MKLKSILIAAVVTATITLPVLSQAAVTLDFEGASGFASINNFYSGGTDSTGIAGSNNFGVSFADSLQALQNDGLGGGVNGAYFSNAPTPGTVMFAPSALDVLTTPAFMNIAAGTFSLSFFYSSDAAAVVNVYSGLNGSGLLGSIKLAANASLGCTDTAFCNFQSVSWAPTATAIKSVDFSANAGAVAFDNITVSPVPEPTSMALMLAGMAGLAVVARRRKTK